MGETRCDTLAERDRGWRFETQERGGETFAYRVVDRRGDECHVDGDGNVWSRMHPGLVDERDAPLAGQPFDC